MAELADALYSGCSIRKDVQVQLLFRAPNIKQTPCKVIIYKGFLFCSDKFPDKISTSLPLTGDNLYSIFTNTPYRNPRVLAVHWPEPKNFRLSSRINAPIGKMSARLG